MSKVELIYEDSNRFPFYITTKAGFEVLAVYTKNGEKTFDDSHDSIFIQQYTKFARKIKDSDDILYHLDYIAAYAEGHA